MGDDSKNWTKFGRYALLEKIGSGGMAEIYRAKTYGAAGFEKEYAIKLIIPSLVDDTEFVDMFINEAKIVVNLYHANIVQVFDLGEIDDQYYIAMEYVHGKDLLDILARCAEKGIKIPLNMVLFISMEMLKGLNFAHRAKDPYGDDLNIIHRDVSPSNILISYAGDVKVGDFGVAKAAVQRSLTSNDTLKGKVGYMSPEQVMGNEIDSRSDIFSAGIVFFEALSMSRLFVGKSDLDVMLKVRDAEIGEAIDRMEALPSDLEDIVRRALTRDPKERFQTAEQFYQALVDFCYQNSIKVTGNDLSNLMTRLFEDEIEEEKSRRRIETNAPPPEIFDRVERSDLDSPVDRPETPAEAGVGDEPTEREADSTDGGTTEAEVIEQRSTLDNPEADFRFRTADGDIYGPMSRDELVELLENRIPHKEDEIAIEEGEWQPIDECDGLDAFLPDYSHELGNQQSSMPHGARIFRHANERASTERMSAEESQLPEESQIPEAEQSGQVADTEADDQLSSSEESQEERVSPDTIADHSLEKSVRAMEEISVAMAEQRKRAGAEQEEKSGFGHDEESQPEVEVDDSLRDLETAPEEEDAASIDELKHKYTSYEGALLETPFPRLLGRLHLSGATGRLNVESDGVEKSIYVRDGEPVLVDSSKKEELLGSFLLSRGIIDQEQLDQALARLHEWGGRLGDALVAIGAVPAHDIYELLSEQMREKLLDIFTWRDGYYGYYENQEPDTKGYPLGVEALKIIVEGCRQYVPFGHLVDFYDNRMNVRIRRIEDPPVDVDRLRLQTRELRVLKQVSDNTSLTELLEEFNSTQKSQVYRIVYLLQQLEIVDFEDTEQRPLPDL